ncbi:TRAP transporter small permease [Paracoccus pacificus]|uniref:TRAP transporter small permease protein n=1 Tax=Paracoccus pacificus TaxID=1463598 RepID=A0ABW4RAK7_9RHOB
MIDRGLAGRLARWLALAGGAVLLALIAMTVISILGRAGLSLSAIWQGAPGWMARLRPLRGDFELIELGSAVAIFAFLPWCQITAGHARVDLVADWLPAAVNRALMRFWDWAMLAVMGVILWRLWVGMIGKQGAGETSFLLGVPVWWAYAAGVFCMVIAVLTAAIIAFSGAAAQDEGAQPDMASVTGIDAE